MFSPIRQSVPAWIFLIVAFYSLHLTVGSKNSNSSDIVPSYILRNEYGHPCLLTTFNITLDISYKVGSGKKGNNYIALKKVPVPDDADTIGSTCEENKTSLVLEWDNSTFSLNFTFITKGLDKQGNPTNWSLDAVIFSYNRSHEMYFPGALSKSLKSVSGHQLDLFNTKIGNSKECDRPTHVQLGNKMLGTTMVIDYIRLAMFNLTSDQFPIDTEVCQHKNKSPRDEDIMVPLIIACALSAVIIAVVVAYAISRKVQETRDQTQYKPMP